jgi:hypothetical protein
MASIAGKPAARLSLFGRSRTIIEAEAWERLLWLAEVVGGAAGLEGSADAKLAWWLSYRGMMEHRQALAWARERLADYGRHHWPAARPAELADEFEALCGLCLDRFHVAARAGDFIIPGVEPARLRPGTRYNFVVHSVILPDGTIISGAETVAAPAAADDQPPAAAPAAPPSNPPASGKRRASVRAGVVTAMRKELADRVLTRDALRDMKEEAMRSRYNASREVCRLARDEVLDGSA